ncbi:hypothetical protein Dimus_025985 [Dionaea muscipula]
MTSDDELFFFAGNGEAPHRMIEPEFFFCAIKQVPEARMAQVRQGHYVSLLLITTNINSNMPFWNCLLALAMLEDPLGVGSHSRQSESHFFSFVVAVGYIEVRVFDFSGKEEGVCD